MADITIDASTATEFQSRANNNWGPFWRSATVCYVCYQDTNRQVGYKKSSDGGQTWGSFVKVLDTAEGSNGHLTMSVYDETLTPGYSGELIHFVGHDWNNDELVYRTVNTASADALGTKRVIASGITGATGGQMDSRGMSSVTRAVGGNLYVQWFSNGSSAFYRSTDSGANWTTRTNTYEATDDKFLLLPSNDTDTNDICMLYYDDSANEVSLKRYDDSANSWSELSVRTSVLPNDDSPHMVRFHGSPRASNGHIYGTIITDENTATADVEAFSVDPKSGGTVSTLTQVLANQTGMSSTAQIFIDNNAGELWAIYSYGTYSTSMNLYAKRSTDWGTTWGTQVQHNNTAFNGLCFSGGMGIKSGTAGRFLPVWESDSANDLFCAYDLSVAISAGGSSPQTTTAQVGTLTLTGVQGSSTGGAVTQSAQVGSIALTGVQGTSTFGNVTTTAQVGTLALTGVQGSSSVGVATTTAQVATVTLAGVQGTSTGGAVSQAAQVGAITLTGVQGVNTGGSGTGAQVATLTLTGVQGTSTGGAVTSTAQVATLTLNGIEGTSLPGAITKTAQVATITLAGVQGTSTNGASNTTAQVGLLTLTGVAGTSTTGAASTVAQAGIITLSGVSIIYFGDPTLERVYLVPMDRRRYLVAKEPRTLLVRIERRVLEGQQ